MVVLVRGVASVVSSGTGIPANEKKEGFINFIKTEKNDRC